MTPRNLSIGMQGEDVRAIQNALNLYTDLDGDALNPDGRFGPRTDAKVRAYQQSKGLVIDGIVGRRTRLALFPFGVATTTVLATRLVMPRFGNAFSARLTSIGADPPPAPRVLNVDWSRVLANLNSQIVFDPGPTYVPIRIPRVRPLVPAPIVPDLFVTPPAVPGLPPLMPFGFVYDHLELAPGAQSTLALGSPTQNAFTITMQSIYRRGPDDGPHQEVAAGVQIGAPIRSGFPNDAPWTFNPFVQLTDVDRILNFGPVHLSQPYAALGFQFQGPGDAHPTITSSLFPLNIGVDINGNLTWTLAGGAIANIDLSNGQVIVGLQASTGLTLKFGAPPPRTPRSGP